MDSWRGTNIHRAQRYQLLLRSATVAGEVSWEGNSADTKVGIFHRTPLPHELASSMHFAAGRNRKFMWERSRSKPRERVRSARASGRALSRALEPDLSHKTIASKSFS